MSRTRIQGRIRWQCRRSCLEIDLLLNDFLDREDGYRCLDMIQQRQFSALLEHSDDVLLAWLMERERPAEQTFADLIGRILR